MRKYIMLIIAVSLCGCATVPEERRGQELAVVGVAALTVGGIVLARSIAKSGRTQVHMTNRTVLGPP